MRTLQEFFDKWQKEILDYLRLDKQLEFRQDVTKLCDEYFSRGEISERQFPRTEGS